MKTFILIPCFVLVIFGSFAQAVGIGTTTPNANAVLDIASATKALIVPRLNSTAISAIAPADGMLVFNTDSKVFLGYSSGGVSPVISQTSTSQSFAVANNETIGQSFTPDYDIKLHSIVLNVGYITAGNTPFTVKLHTGQGYTGTVIGTANATSAGTGLMNFDFSALNLKLNGGQVYTLQAISNGVGAGSVYLSTYTADLYPGGYLYYLTNANPTWDLYFIVKQTMAAGWKPLSN